MTTKPLDLKQFEGHTPGPWRIAPVQTGRYPAYPITAAPAGQLLHVANVPIMARGGSNFDAQIIAAAPALLAECRRLQAENERLREALEDFLQHGLTSGKRGIHRDSLIAQQARAALKASA